MSFSLHAYHYCDALPRKAQVFLEISQLSYIEILESNRTDNRQLRIDSRLTNSRIIEYTNHELRKTKNEKRKTNQETRTTNYEKQRIENSKPKTDNG